MRYELRTRSFVFWSFLKATSVPSKISPMLVLVLLRIRSTTQRFARIICSALGSLHLVRSGALFWVVFTCRSARWNLTTGCVGGSDE